MKKNVLTASAAAFALVVALAGCSSSSAPASSESSDMSASEASVAASEVSEEVSEESVSSSAPSVKWTEAKDAKAAAVGAGLDSFAVPEDDVKLSIGEAWAKDWTFRYTDGIAEADGYAAAATVIVREGAKAGDCTTPLSDYTLEGWSALEDLAYDESWMQEVEDIEVVCFGNKEGVASKMIWNQDQHGFSVQVLGQGDTWADFGIEEDDVEALVGAVIAANSDSDDEASSAAAAKKEAEDDAEATEAAEDEGAAQQTQADDAGDYVEQLVWQNGLGELVSYDQSQDANGNWVLEVVTRGADGNEYTSLIAADGSVLENGYAVAHPESAANDGADAGTETDANANADAGVETNANADANADANTDPNVKKYSNTEAKQAVAENGLGTYMYSQEVQGSDGKIYQEITTRDENGNDSYSYLDSNGNVVSGVDVELRYNNDGTADPAK